jgi:hypothetical protein
MALEHFNDLVESGDHPVPLSDREGPAWAEVNLHIDDQEGGAR